MDAPTEGHDKGDVARTVAMPVNPARVCTALAMSAVALTVLGVGTNLYYASAGRAPDRFQRFVDVNGEGNLPTWFAVVLLAAGAAAAAAVAAQRPITTPRYGDDRDRMAWWAITGLVALMSLDEMTGMHEAAGMLLDDNVEQLGLGQYAWIIPGAAVVLVAANVVARAVASCSPAVRRRLLRSASLFVGAALGIEALEAVLVNEHHNALGNGMHLLTGSQELLEMLAVVLFLQAILEEARDGSLPEKA